VDATIFGIPHEVHINQRAWPKPGPNVAMVAMWTASTRITPYVTCNRAKIAGIVGRLRADSATPAIGLPVAVEPVIIDRLNPVPSDMLRCAESISGGLQACRYGMVGPNDIVLLLIAVPIGMALVEVTRARSAKMSISYFAPERLEAAVYLEGTPIRAGEGFLENVARLNIDEGMPS